MTSKQPETLSALELGKETEIHIDLIKHYIAQGVLPAPVKTSGGIDYYDAGCLELLRLIYNFHHKYSLPLSMIKQVIDEVGHDRVSFISNELEEKLNRARQVDWFPAIPETYDSDETILTREELLEAAGISEEDLDEAVSQNLIVPDEQGRFTQKDIDIAMIISEIKENKEQNSEILAALLNMRLKMTETLVEEEFNVFLKNILNNNISVEDANELAMKSFDLLIDLLPKCYWQLLNKRIKHLIST